MKFKPLSLHKNRPVVAHSISSWLPLTMTWVYTQMNYLEEFSSIVLAEGTENLDYFPWDPIFTFSNQFNRYIFKGMRRLKLTPYPSLYDRAIERQHPILLHSHFGNRGWYDLKIAKKQNLKQIVTFYGFDMSMLPRQQPIWKKRYKELFQQCKVILCEGPHMAKCISGLGCAEDKIIVHRLGVEIDKIPFVPRQLNKKDTVKILIAGTFREKKGIPYALEAIGQLKNKYSDLQVTIIGDSTGEKRDELEKRKIIEMIRRYDLNQIVRMLGFQSHETLMTEAYDHHIFLSPSVSSSDGDTEGGAPITIIEMMASGMPIISTKHCDIPQIIEHDRTGRLADERDVDGLVDHLVWLCDNPDKWESMLLGGRRHVEKFFNAQTQADRLEEIYGKIMDEI